MATVGDDAEKLTDTLRDELIRIFRETGEDGEAVPQCYEDFAEGRKRGLAMWPEMAFLSTTAQGLNFLEAALAEVWAEVYEEEEEQGGDKVKAGKKTKPAGGSGVKKDKVAKRGRPPSAGPKKKAGQGNLMEEEEPEAAGDSDMEQDGQGGDGLFTGGEAILAHAVVETQKTGLSALPTPNRRNAAVKKACGDSGYAKRLGRQRGGHEGHDEVLEAEQQGPGKTRW
jgi:hypothetical protein